MLHEMVFNLNTFQAAVGHWHVQTFPEAKPSHIALKLAEETGEVCRAIVESNFPSRSGHARESLADELADVLIVLAALASRCGISLAKATEARWAVIEARP